MAPAAISDLQVSGAPLDFTSFRNIIAGKPVDSKTHVNGTNPATLEKLPDVPIATKDDLETAVKSARTAFAKWSKTPFEERKAAVLKWADGLENLSSSFAALLTKEQGKPVSILYRSNISVTSNLCRVSKPTWRLEEHWLG